MNIKPELTIENLEEEAKIFCFKESSHQEASLYGINDGKAVGTYLEHKFQNYLEEKYTYVKENSAKGIDFPELLVDLKVTSIKQPQSSCPFKSARQKIFGLGYSLLIFVYDKIDHHRLKTSQLDIKHCIFVSGERTADYQTTTGIIRILENDGNKDDILAFFEERMLPVDEIEANLIAEELLNNKPLIGYLTISNALQWRLQYSRVIEKANQIDGILKIK
jgi:hypothetical protein